MAEKSDKTRAGEGKGAEQRKGGEHGKQDKRHGHPGAGKIEQMKYDAAMAEKEGLRLIVRIANTDLNGTKSIQRSLTKIKGIGLRTAKNIAIAFQRKTGLDFSQKLGKLSEEQSKELEDVVLNLSETTVPKWTLNRQKDFATGKNMHLVMSDLDFSLRSDLQRMSETKSYKGLRHIWGLPVRGQKTKSTHRGKGPVVGVMKKDAKEAAAPAKKSVTPAAAPAAAKEAKK